MRLNDNPHAIGCLKREISAWFACASMRHLILDIHGCVYTRVHILIDVNEHTSVYVVSHLYIHMWGLDYQIRSCCLYVHTATNTYTHTPDAENHMHVEYIKHMCCILRHMCGIQHMCEHLCLMSIERERGGKKHDLICSIWQLLTH